MSAKIPQRETYRISRLLDYCSRKELIAQTGHQPAEWPLVALKELLDNGLDACEEAGVWPQITIRVDGDGITVTDNGPGLLADTIDGLLDFSVRVSSREAYCSPTRGAQGNALKTLIPMPLVLDGRQGQATISARGIRHDIALSVDPFRQQPVVDHRPQPDGLVKTGTAITLHWPKSACQELHAARERFLQLAGDFTCLNPHLTLAVSWFGNSTRTGTAKQKLVLDETGLARLGLSALRNGIGLDHERTASLLAAMKRLTRSDKPAALGVIGKANLARRFEGLGCDMDTFEYRKQTGLAGGAPWVAEAAFAWGPRLQARRLVTGVNWSPGIVNPFRQLGRFSPSLDTVLARQRSGHAEPVVLVVHVACPRVDYTDRGKSAVVIAGDAGEEG
jgi:DNA topoisomerase VI subunit B